MWRIQLINGTHSSCFSYHKNFLFQWHITERCNLRCTHCYQDSFSSPELDLNSLTGVLEQFKHLMGEHHKKNTGHTCIPKAHITLTGGEPFIRQDFFSLLERIYRERNLFTFAILTNGSLLDRPSIQYIRQINPLFIQVSLEGSRQTHDKIRGNGHYDQVVEAIKMLKKAKIPTYISFTAHRFNYLEFPEVAKLGFKLNVDMVWADRLIPVGSGSNELPMVLSPKETKEFITLMASCKKKKLMHYFKRTNVATHRALQFLVAGGKPYFCHAGKSLLTILPNGDLVPCRRMPIPCGNILKESLTSLYYNSSVLKNLRVPGNLNQSCTECFYAGLCQGGLKCLSYAIHHDPFAKDPGCWL